MKPLRYTWILILMLHIAYMSASTDYGAVLYNEDMQLLATEIMQTGSQYQSTVYTPFGTTTPSQMIHEAICAFPLQEDNPVQDRETKDYSIFTLNTVSGRCLQTRMSRRLEQNNPSYSQCSNESMYENLRYQRKRTIPSPATDAQLSYEAVFGHPLHIVGETRNVQREPPTFGGGADVDEPTILPIGDGGLFWLVLVGIYVVLMQWRKKKSITYPKLTLFALGFAFSLPLLAGTHNNMLLSDLVKDYPVFGTSDITSLPALQVSHANGDQTLQLYEAQRDTLQGTGFTEYVRTFRDSLYPVQVSLCCRVYADYGIGEQWMEIQHQEKKPITLKHYDSGCLRVPRGDVWLTYFVGDWAAEGTPVSMPLRGGTVVVQNTDGSRNAHLTMPAAVLSLDGQLSETNGRTVAATLCWSGNYTLQCTTTNDGYHRLYAGICPLAAEYVLPPRQLFRTPALVFAYSEEGIGGCSRSLHQWARDHKRILHSDDLRPVLLNSWEGIYFDITEERIKGMMDDIADMGGELFVMDDGWFGGKYPRNTDNAALGDWQVDSRKLPNGLQPLIDYAHSRGIRLGIWIEPESTNTLSELYEKHPEWVLQNKGRTPKAGRGGTQLLLDLTNPQVQDYIFNMVDTLLTRYPDIAYIKWDANTPMQNYGSLYLPADRQTNLAVEYHRGLEQVLQRIRTKYPDVIMQNCASGGGRANYGLMPYFDEMWVSDNNDALQRIYIWWTYSYFFPPITLAQHIGGSPYHMTGRVVPIKFRCDVAMAGRMGMELQPKDMTYTERKQCAQAIHDYKAIRPLVQHGDLYRLVSPYADKHIAAMMYVAPNQQDAVLFAYRMDYLRNSPVENVVLSGLSSEATYRVSMLNEDVNGKQPTPEQHISGTELMEKGLSLPLDHDYASVVVRLQRIEQ